MHFKVCEHPRDLRETNYTVAKKYNKIKEVLAEKDKTQTWLAGQLDVDFVTISRYVNNHRQPAIETLFEIARIVKVNPKDLLNS